eukprot:547347_1
MPDNYIISRPFAGALMEDLCKLSQMRLLSKNLRFQWDCDDSVFLRNKFQINTTWTEYYDRLAYVEKLSSQPNQLIQFSQRWQTRQEEEEEKRKRLEAKMEAKEVDERDLERQKNFNLEIKYVICEKEKILLSAFVREFIIWSCSGLLFPMDVMRLCLEYLKQAAYWDKETTNDNYLELSKDGLTVTKPEICDYPRGCYFSTILMNRWLTVDGRYFFKFRFKGELKANDGEIAIGFYSEKNDQRNKYYNKGIGA